MLKHTFFIFFLLVFVLSKTVAQDAYTDQVKKYIDKYYTLALQEQKRAGIPASITLAQAIHETDAGSSDLMTKANNHFGLKCKSDWKGETYIHSDNTPNECFKKYKTAQESYKDRSDHLKKNDRYASLFTYSITDYAAWAIGLKTCGYATNQQYSVKLIKIIEDYHLQEYTYMAIEGANAKNYPVEGNTAINKKPVRKSADVDVEDNDKTDSLRKIVDSMRIAMTTKLSTTHKDNTKAIPDNPKATKIPKAKTNDDPKTENNEEKISSATDKVFDSGKIVVINGLKAFYAYKDEMLLKYAVKYKIRYPHLLELNDLPDAPLQNNMPIYIEKKLASGTHTRHTVKKNENMQLIAQEEGMMLKRLYQLNKIEPNEEPIAGAILELQTQVAGKPKVVLATQKKKAVNKIEDKADKKQIDSNYVTINHPKPNVPDTTAADDTVDETENVKITQPTVRKKPQLLKEDTSAEDLNGLKADLDRVVYADNSKLKTNQQAKQGVQPTAVKPEAKSPKKEVAKKPKMHTIKRGDTLGDIAEKYNTSAKQLRAWNHISGNKIAVGKKIRVQ